MSSNSADGDFISRRLGELRDQSAQAGSIYAIVGRTDKVVGRTQRLVLCLAVIAFLVFWISLLAVWRTYASERVLLDKLATLEARMGHGVKVSVEQWTSPPFASGGATCDAHEGKDGPCTCWYSTAPSSSTQCTPVGSIARANQNAVLVLAAGGHDKEDLTDSMRNAICCNKQLAFARANLVAAAFQQSLDEVRRGAPDLQYPTTRFLSSTRGAHDFTLQDPQDRTVTLTLVRVQESR